MAANDPKSIEDYMEMDDKDLLGILRQAPKDAERWEAENPDPQR